MIVIINYGMGNSGSILNMLKKIGADAIISSNIEDIKNANKLILPGVGSFENGIENLVNLGLIPVLNSKINEDKVPILGICLGMQLFTRGSEEGNLGGLGWIDGQTVRFRFDEANKCLKIPNMDWNNVHICKEGLLFKDIYEESRFYFVHSYHVVCNDEKDILTKTFYGYEFVSSLQNRNIMGVQFHPEKSHTDGLNILKNFLN